MARVHKTSQRYCMPCDLWLPAQYKQCPDCGADTDKAEPEQPRDEAYERAQRSDEWERRGGGGL